MSPAERDARASLIEVCRRAEALGLNRGTSGNASRRWGDGLLVTPTALPYRDATPEDVVAIDVDGQPTGRRRPSSEWGIHHRILRERPEVGAVLHLHSPAATALACLREGIPPFHYMVAVAGGATIRCAPYATFGTKALSDHARAALDGRRACLLVQHGIVALGASLEAALELAVEVETLARMYQLALQVGEPARLDATAMAEAHARFARYRPDPT